MKHKFLQDALPFLKEVDKERQRQFEFYFRNAPLWVMDLLQSEELEPGTTFIRENEPADTIFFIGRGRAKATDYRISGIAYDFMKPKEIDCIFSFRVQTDWHFFLLNGLRNSTEMANSASMKADRALRTRLVFVSKALAGE